MENIKTIFKEDITRKIQGVINVDDTNNIFQELKEYVVTDDLVNQFGKFYNNFNESIGIGNKCFAMAAWISGYFGSGKSHFLKMLSYLLENKEIDGKKPYEFFEDKLKSDPMVYAQVKRAAEVSKDVMLFNIDSKTQSNISRDKIVAVFERVFNEKIGYCHIPYVAEFERYLDSIDKYEEFKKDYKEISGNEWTNDRRFFITKMDEITATYCKTLGKSKAEADNWFTHIQDDYSVTIFDFAEKVKNYIEKKGNDHHVIFMIDEVGQFMGGDNQVALNLQSITENLGSCCGGKAWVVVTSQEDINSFIKILKNDYSKNQDRFQTKISLSSRDVADIIKKRLLDKKVDVIDSLKNMYEKDSISITNLLSLNDAAFSQSKIYEDADDFYKTYPFIPYQFQLVQDTFIDVREQKFAREHLSSGERSLLGAFQDAVKKHIDGEIGTIIPFYSFYDTIENFLNHQIKLVFKKAEESVKGKAVDELGLKVLKVLFMIKNIKGLKGTVENITALCIDNISCDKVELKNQVSDSLEKLVNENLVAMYEDEYRFLTNDEQEVNRAIQSIVPDDNEYSKFLYSRIFESIYPDTKYRYINNQDFNFTKYIDDKNIKGMEYDIGIKIWTGTLGDETNRNIESMNNANLLYITLNLPRSVDESIQNINKIRRFIRENGGIEQRSEIEAIIKSKKVEADKLEKVVTERLKEEFSNAELTIFGNTVPTSKRTPKERIEEGLSILVKNVFSKLTYIETYYSNQNTREDFAKKEKGLIDPNAIPNKMAYDDMVEYLKEQSAFSKIVTVKSLLQKYNQKPYGFRDEDIIYLIMRLMKNEIINLVYANAKLDSQAEDTINKLLNRQNYEKIIIKLREKISQDVIDKAKTFLRDEFGEVSLSDNEDELLTKILQVLKNYSDKLRELIGRYAINKTYTYPGKSIIEEAIKYFDEFKNIKRDPQVFFSEFSKYQDRLSMLHKKSEEVFEFFDGAQVRHFDNAVKTAEIYINNAQFLAQDVDINEKFNTLDAILKNENPYSEIQQLEGIRQDIIKLIGNAYNEKSEPTIKLIEEKMQEMKNMLSDIDDTNSKGKLEIYINQLKDAKEKLERTNELKEIYAANKFIEDVYGEFLDTYEGILLELKKKDEVKNKNIKITKRIMVNNLFERPLNIKSNDDIDIFINNIKEKLEKELNNGNDIVIM